MRVAPRILTAVFILLLTGNAVAAVDMAPFTGDYWYDWIGVNNGGAEVGSGSGVATITSDSVSITSVSWPNANPNDPLGFTFTDASLDVDGYLTLQVEDDPETEAEEGGPETVFANGHFISKLSDGTDHVEHELMVRIAEDPIAGDLSGDYMMFRYAMHGNFEVSNDVTETEGCLGTATLTAGTPNTWSANFIEINSSMTPVSKEGTGGWTLDSDAGTMVLTGMPSDIELKIGTGGILTSTVVDDGVEGGEGPARLLLIKKGTGRTIDDAVGRYTLQGFNSDTNGAEFWTTWGTLDVFDDYTWTETRFSSNKAGSETFDGRFTIADDGTMVFTGDEGDINGILSLDGDLISLAAAEPGPSGKIKTTFAMRPLAVPEPSTLALLLLGSLGWMVLRRRG